VAAAVGCWPLKNEITADPVTDKSRPSNKQTARGLAQQRRHGNEKQRVEIVDIKVYFARAAWHGRSARTHVGRKHETGTSCRASKKRGTNAANKSNGGAHCKCEQTMTWNGAKDKKHRAQKQQMCALRGRKKKAAMDKRKDGAKCVKKGAAK
jgi:hypothetical protein